MACTNWMLGETMLGRIKFLHKWFFEPRVGNFKEKKAFLELKSWRIGGRPLKLIVSSPIHVMNHSFELALVQKTLIKSRILNGLLSTWLKKLGWGKFLTSYDIKLFDPI